ncbi:MAG: hypothetical protein M1134_06065 [Actinobacteria bacterium]|nr:hypothetical protein [Actinomycetota bacterium]MCL5444535.1 hypothetical protein [Actinomycetota bacterium]
MELTPGIYNPRDLAYPSRPRYSSPAEGPSRDPFRETLKVELTQAARRRFAATMPSVTSIAITMIFFMR